MLRRAAGKIKHKGEFGTRVLAVNDDR